MTEAEKRRKEQVEKIEHGVTPQGAPPPIDAVVDRPYENPAAKAEKTPAEKVVQGDYQGIEYKEDIEYVPKPPKPEEQAAPAEEREEPGPMRSPLGDELSPEEIQIAEKLQAGVDLNMEVLKIIYPEKSEGELQTILGKLGRRKMSGQRKA